MLRPVYISDCIDSEGGEKEMDKLKFKLTPVKCKYHELTHGAGQELCLACGVPYDPKKAKLFRYLDKMRRKGRKKK